VITLKVPCSLEYRDVVLRVIAGACRLVRPRRVTDPDPEFDHQITTSIGEVFTNLVRHGDPGAEGGIPDIEIEIEPWPDRLTIRVLDRGTPFDPAGVPAPDLTALPESGLGLHIVKSWMDEVSYLPKGHGGGPGANVLSMTKRVGDFSRRDDGNQTTLVITGVLDATTAPGIRRTVDAIVSEQRSPVTVDLSSLQHVDSSGVGVIVSLYKRCRAFGGTVRIAGLREQPLSIFKLLRLDRVFDLG
jgi:anti-anti-sigma factor